MEQLRARTTYCKNVKMLRIKKGLTLEEMGKLLGVTRQRVWSIENGDVFFSEATLEAFAQIFKVEETDLLDPGLEERLK